ncbi:hypothetical protein C0Q70_12701 [Pomacea canaliculata]|uniref:MACPF domain-containing protein n=1 Tax=Pomacea canaliculata TaxID=400727 RepID=A0A2T7P295_POMCA|nr:hypothetical protein C0Q70_12701 [Pomacea canaliculata]
MLTTCSDKRWPATRLSEMDMARRPKKQCLYAIDSSTSSNPVHHPCPLNNADMFLRKKKDKEEKKEKATERQGSRKRKNTRGAGVQLVVKAYHALKLILTFSLALGSQTLQQSAQRSQSLAQSERSSSHVFHNKERTEKLDDDRQKTQLFARVAQDTHADTLFPEGSCRHKKQGGLNADFLLYGYNSLKGCPLVSGRDPGFTLPIFSADHSSSHVTPDGEVLVPRELLLSPDVSCVTSFTSKTVETPYDLTKLLTGTATLGDDGGWGPPFSTSQDFRRFSKDLRKHVLVVSRATCSVHHVTHLLQKPLSLHPMFVDWVLRLNNTDDEDAYLQFIDTVPKAQVMLQLQGMDYSLFGYNSLKGCPLTSGRDPGFTLPIFSGEFHVTPDFRYSVPRGVLLSHDVSCDTSFTSKVVETPYDLTTLLTGTARLGADKWGPPFSASQHIHKLSEELRKHVLVVTTAVCSLYDLTLLLTEPPSFHSSFVDWMIKLNNTDDEDMYLKFIDTYGTHFVSRARLGASRTVIYKMDDNVYRLLTEDHVTSAASYSAPELFGHHEDLTSDQQKAIAEFRNHETTTFAVGVPLPDGGNSATWLTAAKDNPSVIDYDLTSVEVLFSDTFMGAASPTGGYGIDYDRIKKNIMAVKTKYCRTLKSKDLLVDCRDTGRTLLSTKLIGNTKYGAAESADQCLEECYQLAGCVAVSFCPGCTRDNRGSKCQVFSAGDIHRAVNDRQWQTIMLVDKLETFVKLHNTMVVVNSSSLSDVPPVNSSSLSEVPPVNSSFLSDVPPVNSSFLSDVPPVNSSSLSEVPPVTSVQDCYPSCIQDTQCVAFTLTDTSGSLIKCTRHTDSPLSLTQGTGVSVYFVSPLVKRIITSGQTRGLAPSSMLNDWYKAACVIDDECRQEKSKCFLNRCRCRPGLFFSTRDYTCSESKY